MDLSGEDGACSFIMVSTKAVVVSKRVMEHITEVMMMKCEWAIM